MVFPRKNNPELNGYGHEDEEGELLGFCFANFETHEYAVDAIRKMHGKIIAWKDHKPLPEVEAKKFIEEHPDRDFGEDEFWGSLCVCKAQTKEVRHAMNIAEHKNAKEGKESDFADAVAQDRVLFIKGVTKEITKEDIYDFFSGDGASRRDGIMRPIESVCIFPFRSEKDQYTAATVVFFMEDDCVWACSIGTAVIHGVSLTLSRYLKKK